MLIPRAVTLLLLVRTAGFSRWSSVRVLGAFSRMGHKRPISGKGRNPQYYSSFLSFVPKRLLMHIYMDIWVDLHCLVPERYLYSQIWIIQIPSGPKLMFGLSIYFGLSIWFSTWGRDFESFPITDIFRIIHVSITKNDCMVYIYYSGVKKREGTSLGEGGYELHSPAFTSHCSVCIHSVILS